MIASIKNQIWPVTYLQPVGHVQEIYMQLLIFAFYEHFLCNVDMLGDAGAVTSDQKIEIKC